MKTLKRFMSVYIKVKWFNVNCYDIRIDVFYREGIFWKAVRRKRNCYPKFTLNLNRYLISQFIAEVSYETFCLHPLRVPKCLTYRSVKNISTLSVHQTRWHLQTSHSRDGESTKSMHKQYNSSLIKWSGLLFFFNGAVGVEILSCINS